MTDGTNAGESTSDGDIPSTNGTFEFWPKHTYRRKPRVYLMRSRDGDPFPEKLGLSGPNSKNNRIEMEKKMGWGNWARYDAKTEVDIPDTYDITDNKKKKIGELTIHHFLYPVLRKDETAAQTGEHTDSSEGANAAQAGEIVLGVDNNLRFFVDDRCDRACYEKKYAIRFDGKEILLVPKPVKEALATSDAAGSVFYLETESTLTIGNGSSSQNKVQEVQVLFCPEGKFGPSTKWIKKLTLKKTWSTENQTKLKPVFLSFLRDRATGGPFWHSEAMWKTKENFQSEAQVRIYWKNTEVLKTYDENHLEGKAQNNPNTLSFSDVFKGGENKGLNYWSLDEESDCRLVIKPHTTKTMIPSPDDIPHPVVRETLISKWFDRGSNDFGGRDWLLLHLHHPVVFPFSTGQDWVQGNAHGALTDLAGTGKIGQCDKCHFSVWLWHALDDLIQKDSGEVKYWHKKARTGLHFDYMTDLVVYADNPYKGGNEMYARLLDQKQVILYGPPGTRKTWRAKHESRWMVDWCLARKFDTPSPPASSQFIQMVQFHPAYCYEDFIQGLRPVPKGGSLDFEVQDGHFKRFCERAGVIERIVLELEKRDEKKEKRDVRGLLASTEEALKPFEALGIKLEADCTDSLTIKWPERKRGESNPERPGSFKMCKVIERAELSEGIDRINLPPFVFIIDEINRANLSAVLGELMYCLEYRGFEHARELPLSRLQKKDSVFKYASELFFVPRNVYVVGTMNTIDKSTERVDFALRRRFGWWKCDPQPWLADQVMRRKHGQPTQLPQEWRVQDQLTELNKLLRNDLSRLGGDFQIGETYFFNLPKFGDEVNEARKKLWSLQLSPLLEDFYGDPKRWTDAKMNQLQKALGIPTGEEQAPEKDWPRVKKALGITPQAILYGPPGTGKTHAVSESDERKQDVPAERFELIQFHPAYTYEDFLQGLRPVPKQSEGGADGISYNVRPGLFKRLCMKAGEFERGLFHILAPLKEGQGPIRKTPSGTTAPCCGWKYIKCEWKFEWEYPSSHKHSVTISSGEKQNAEENTVRVSVSYNGHPEEAVQIPFATDPSVTFDEVVDHILSKVSDKLPRYLLVIDEVNRADLSAVFGELMYCLEYRGPTGYVELPTTAEGEDRFATLNGREVFFVPRNLWIVGTMNTIDRSTEPVDFAMRRRFNWLKFDPTKDFGNIILDNIGKIKAPKQDLRGQEEAIAKAIVTIAEKVNEKLKTDRFPEGYRIGETYYFKIVEILAAMMETCSFMDRHHPKNEGIHAQVHYGPFGDYGIKGKRATPASVLYWHHIAPLLEDYHQQQARKWEPDGDYAELFCPETK